MKGVKITSELLDEEDDVLWYENDDEDDDTRWIEDFKAFDKYRTIEAIWQSCPVGSGMYVQVLNESTEEDVRDSILEAQKQLKGQ